MLNLKNKALSYMNSLPDLKTVVSISYLKIIKTATFRQSAITSISTMVNGLLGALFYIVLARALGPADFGLITISITTLTMLADITNFGTNTSLVRFVPKELASNKPLAFKYLKLTLEVRVLTWIGVILVGWFTAPFAAGYIFNKPELAFPLQLAILGVGGALLFTFATSALQAFQKFISWGVVNILVNLFRLGLVFLLIAFSQLNLANSLWIYILLPFFGFFVSLLILPTRQFIKASGETKVSREFFNYNLWVTLFTVVAAVSARLDTFLSGRLLSVKEVGIYGAANQLVTVIPQLVSALGIVVAPKYASFTSKDQMFSYFKKLQLFVILLSLLGLIALPIASYLIPQILGKEYLDAISVFVVLYLGMLVFLISVPVHNSIFYYFGKPQFFIWLSLGHLAIIGIVGYLMILNYGVMGGALTVLAGMIFNFIVPLIWFLWQVKR